jgi:hypothetical protein
MTVNIAMYAEDKPDDIYFMRHGGRPNPLDLYIRQQIERM